MGAEGDGGVALDSYIYMHHDDQALRRLFKASRTTSIEVDEVSGAEK